MIVNDINDHAPEFDLPIYSTNVVEDQPKGQQVIRVTATDLDIGSNAEVRYVLVNNTAADYFDIDSVTGMYIENLSNLLHCIPVRLYIIHYSANIHSVGSAFR